MPTRDQRRPAHPPIVAAVTDTSGSTRTGNPAGTAGRRAGTGASTAYGCTLRRDAGRRHPALGHNDIARSAWAVMVSAGLTPRLAETADPSTTEMPG